MSRNIYWKHELHDSTQENKEQDNNPGIDTMKYMAEAVGNRTTNDISRQLQKRRIKRKYAEMKRQGQVGTIKEKVMTFIESSFFSLREAVYRHSQSLIFLLLGAVIVISVMGLCTSCAAIFQGSTGTVLGTSYTAEDEDILGANEDYCDLEEKLQKDITHIERTHPGYDEYIYELQEISHNPYELTAYLTVCFEDYKRSGVQSELLALFSEQYLLEFTERIEIRTREEVRTGYRTVIDPETGLEKMEEYQYVEEVPYEYKILCVNLVNRSLGTVINEIGLSAEQRERYEILMETKGNRAYLFEEDIYANTGEYLDYDIPGEALTDTEFAAIIREAEKYLGRPYVWGGSTPQTGFDCSGFVCWVLNQIGISVGRTTANGIKGKCDIIPPSEARPGDLIFFQGTYNVPGASHVGIYVGNNMMIHCGNPISYAHLSSAYWQEHFYCFGRL